MIVSIAPSLSPQRLTTWFLLLLALVLAAPSTLLGLAWTRPAGELYLRGYYVNSGAGSYGDADGENVAELRTVLGDGDDRSTWFQSFEYDENIGGLYAEYGLADNLSLIADLPFGSFTLKETYQQLRERDSVLYLVEVDSSFSLTSVIYYGLGLRYRFHERDGVVGALTAQIRLPPGFSDGIVDNPDYDFLSDGAVEIAGGVELGLTTNYGWIGAAVRYNHRAEELEDFARISLETGLNTIPDSYLKFMIDIVQSLASFDDAREFSVRESPLQSSYIAFGASFGMFLSETFFVDVNYSLNLSSTNTWRLTKFGAGGGFKL